MSKIIFLTFIEIIFPMVCGFPSHWIRIKAIRWLGVKVGKNVTILRGCKFLNPCNIEIQDNAVINQNVLLDGRGGYLCVCVGADIARDVRIWTLQHDIKCPDHKAVGKPVRIGDYAWIASGATILPGVNIGAHSAVAASAVVSKDIKCHDVVAGNPARIIGKRVMQNQRKNTYRPLFR